MKSSLKDKKILLGLTGSIAAYRAVDIIRRLTEEGATVNAVMTEAARNFITPLTVASASGNRVHSGLFENPLAHISLSKEADLMLVAPATANIIGKLAHGIADDLLSTLFLSFRGPVVVAPAMNWRMYGSPVFRKNLDGLRALGVVEVPPGKGRLACGEEGVGRMADVETITEAVKAELSVKDLSGERVVVTAGPTREHIDSVRFISNRSTGKMGYALAKVARRRSADVTLISGPSSLGPPAGVEFVPVETAGEMRDAVRRLIKNATVFIMAAAVTDFLPEKRYEGKIDKSGLRAIKLKKTPDILMETGRLKKRPLLVGFAAEEGGRIRRARAKLLEKGADLIVFNDISSEGSGFGTDTNKIVIIDKSGMREFPLLSKEDASGVILDRVAELRGKSS